MSIFPAGSALIYQRIWRALGEMTPPLSMAVLAIVDVLAGETAEGSPAQDGVDEEQPADGEPDLCEIINGLANV